MSQAGRQAAERHHQLCQARGGREASVMMVMMPTDSKNKGEEEAGRIYRQTGGWVREGGADRQ